MTNFFELFELPVSFDLDPTDLEKRYFAVQRVCHPDRFAGKPPAERQQAILRSMQANEAYDALKEPLTRARHMLAQQGIEVGGEKDNQKPTPELLMEIMDLRESMEDGKSRDVLLAQQDANQKQMSLLLAALSTSFQKKEWQQAAAQTLRLNYLKKIAEELRLKLKGV